MITWVTARHIFPTIWLQLRVFAHSIHWLHIFILSTKQWQACTVHRSCHTHTLPYFAEPVFVISMVKNILMLLQIMLMCHVCWLLLKQNIITTAQLVFTSYFTYSPFLCISVSVQLAKYIWSHFWIDCPNVPTLMIPCRENCFLDEYLIARWVYLWKCQWVLWIIYEVDLPLWLSENLSKNFSPFTPLFSSLCHEALAVRESCTDRAHDNCACQPHSFQVLPAIIPTMHTHQAASIINQ